MGRDTLPLLLAVALGSSRATSNRTRGYSSSFFGLRNLLITVIRIGATIAVITVTIIVFPICLLRPDQKKSVDS